METLQLLGAALGLATLAGINLYLTVFVAGLAIQQGWITLHPQYEQLAVLGDPWIVGVAGVLFFFEFFADKVPWIDSLWDSLHTLIRPIGGALLAITVLGDSDPVYDVLVGLLGGGVALTAHGMKAGTRLLANASPEPFSNLGLSLVEDAAVLGGLALIYHSPIAALVIALVVAGLAIWLAPKIFRASRTTLWFLWRRFHHATGSSRESVPAVLPSELEIALHRAHGNSHFKPKWAAPCVAGRGAFLRGNTFGWLLLTTGAAENLDFARNVGSEPRLEAIPLAGWKALHRPGFVCDKVELYELNGRQRQTFQFDRSRREQAAELARQLNSRASETPADALAPA